jgi:hypothetical protein
LVHKDFYERKEVEIRMAIVRWWYFDEHDE